MNSVLAVILAYNPEEETVRNISLVKRQVAHVVVVDNTPDLTSRDVLRRCESENVSFIFNSENKGVAEGYNIGVRWGLRNNYQYFLLLDQDSRLSEGMVASLLSAYSHLSAANDLVLVGAGHQSSELQVDKLSIGGIKRVPLLITSGSLLTSDLIQKVGLYDERFFIDHVDHDYCLRIQKAGGQCFCVSTASLVHRFGEGQRRRFFGKSFFLQNYSSNRRYYMMRNRIVLYRRYGLFFGAWFWLDLRSAVKDFVKLVLFESQKGAKLYAMMRGVVDGIFWRE